MKIEMDSNPYDDYSKYRFKKGIKIMVLIFILILLYIVEKGETVEASEVDQEESSVNLELEETAPSEQEDVGADEELLLFGYLTKYEDAAITLARIYNVLLTILYVMLINIGRQIIVRCLRKGTVKRGLVE